MRRSYGCREVAHHGRLAVTLLNALKVCIYELERLRELVNEEDVASIDAVLEHARRAVNEQLKKQTGGGGR